MSRSSILSLHLPAMIQMSLPSHEVNPGSLKTNHHSAKLRQTHHNQKTGALEFWEAYHELLSPTLVGAVVRGYVVAFQGLPVDVVPQSSHIVQDCCSFELLVCHEMRLRSDVLLHLTIQKLVTEMEPEACCCMSERRTFFRSYPFYEWAVLDFDDMQA